MGACPGFYPSLTQAGEVGSTTAPLTFGGPDSNTPYANSTVLIAKTPSGFCSGTLIAPDIVLTAGHCGFHADPDGRNPNQWVRVSHTRITVLFGNNRNRPIRSIPANYVNISGSEDIVMLGLSSTVPQSLAIPRKPLTKMPNAASRNPSQYWRNQNFQIAGYGLNATNSFPAIRQIAGATGGDWQCTTGCVRATNQICVNRGTSGSFVRGGDSGGPLYWTDPADRQNYVIGATQRFCNGKNTFTVTFGGALTLGRGAGEAPIEVTLGQWIEKATRKSLCAQLKEQADRSARVRRLYLWWSPGREDNFTTANPTWAGCDPDRDRFHLDYFYNRVEGVVFSAEFPQPRGTIPLYSWWHASRGDNFITSDPQWRGNPGSTKSGYKFVRLEGYIYSPGLPQPPGTKPLYSWWSPGRGDNFATTHPDWTPSSRSAHGDYRYYRLEGYVMPGS